MVKQGVLQLAQELLAKHHADDGDDDLTLPDSPTSVASSAEGSFGGGQPKEGPLPFPVEESLKEGGGKDVNATPQRRRRGSRSWWELATSEELAAEAAGRDDVAGKAGEEAAAGETSKDAVAGKRVKAE